MICAGCLEDRSAIVYDDGDMLICHDCWPNWERRINDQRARDAKIGHTGDDLCGCSRCAAAYERGSA